MAYQVIFDAAVNDNGAWLFPAYGLPFVALGVAMVVWSRRYGHIPFMGWKNLPRASAVFAWFFLLFSTSWVAVGSWSAWSEYTTLHSAMESGKVSVVEGVVTKFEPMPITGHAMERFCVQTHCFAYSDNVTTSGFNNTSSHGGPMREGLQVRIGYVGNTIVKLEIAEPAIPLEIVNNFPVVDVSIDGQTIPVAFDLGGDDTIELTTTALGKIEVRYLQDRYTWLDAKGHQLEARKFVIPELRIGSAVFRDVEGHEDAEAPDWPKIRAGQGRLGRSLFTSRRLELDYRGKTMRLDSKCAGHQVPFDPAWDGEAVSKAGTDIGELTFVWDTGAPMSLIQAKRGLTSTKSLVLAGKDFGPLQLRALAFVQPEGVDGFIGYDFFARHTVCVDFPGRAFWVE